MWFTQPSRKAHSWNTHRITFKNAFFSSLLFYWTCTFSWLPNSCWLEPLGKVQERCKARSTELFIQLSPHLVYTWTISVRFIEIYDSKITLVPSLRFQIKEIILFCYTNDTLLGEKVILQLIYSSQFSKAQITQTFQIYFSLFRVLQT